MIPWQFSWNNVRQRPLRTLLTILSITGGVAAVVAVLQSAAATRGQLDSLHNTLASRVAMEIVADDTSPFSPDDLPNIADRGGVRAAIPVFRVFVKIVAGSEEARGLAIGVDLDHYREIRDFEMIAGCTCKELGEICLEAGVAERLNVSIGDEVRFGAKGLPWMLPKKVVGILKPSGIDAVEETASAFFTLADGAALGKSPRKVTSIQISLEPEAESDDVADEIRPLLPEPLILVKAASAAEMARPTEEIINIGLNVAAALSIVAAIFIVVNTFQISVAERRRQLALLRIVGATTEQVRKSMYWEAFAFGVAGTLLGILLGIAGSGFLAKGVRDIFGFSGDVHVAIQPLAIFAGIIFGPVITMLSVWQPARSACEAQPLAVLKSSFAPQRSFPFRASIQTAIFMLALACVMLTCTYFDIWSKWTCIVGISCFQIASLLFLPSLIKPISSLLFWPLRRISPVEAGLGQQQLLDNFGRTVLTIAVLFVVSSISISIGNTTLILTNDVKSWLDRTLTSDFLLRASRPRVDMSESEALPDTLEPRLAKIHGIESIDRISFTVASIDGVTATLLVREFNGYEGLPIDLLNGSPAEVSDGLRAGEIVLGSVLAHRLHRGPGEFVRMDISGISQEMRIAAVAKEYTAGGLMVIMDSDAAGQIFPIQPPQVYGIRTVRHLTEDVGKELQAVAREQGLIFQSLADLRDLVQSMILGLTNRLWLILILALVIAAFAIVNTQSMNVLEQTRQLGVLRVVGMSRFQVFRMFQLQALVLGLLAIVPAAIVGVVMAYLITISFRGVSDQGVTFSLYSLFLGYYIFGGILLSVAAAALPAIRAGRLRPLEAIHEE